jgi:L-ascorbate metabolism protein UlaG (beta-lactamase superfamily)|uniref:MBL fold metallo-hydrolase n=1 Tax=Desulfobacca acetoxidans TaxID=60893 RepID=A0A7C3SM21_9BACT
MIDEVLSRLGWLGYASFVYEGPPVIYFDPFGLHRTQPADIILVTHEHPQHCSTADIEKVRRAWTVVVSDKKAAAKIEPPVLALEPWEEARVEDTLIQAVPAYNVETHFHPKRAGYLGFIVTVEGVRIYYAGDTDFIPEMADLHVDIAILPVCGLTVMDAEEAARAALALKPQVAIPMHFGGTLGTLEDAETFRALLDGKVRVEILPKV